MPINERLHLIKYIQKHTIGNNEDLTSLSDAELRNRVQVIESTIALKKKHYGGRL